MARMTDTTLKALLSAKLTHALGYHGGRLASERAQALRYYRGELFGNEVEGRSQVVSRDVAEAIDGMLPSLLRIFSSSDQVVQFLPNRPEDEAAAEQATDFVNWIWSRQNAGFTTFYTWFKDALLQKLGVVKIWWDPTPRISTETYQGLSDDELALLLADPDVEPLEHSEYPDPTSVPPAPPVIAPVLPSPGTALRMMGAAAPEAAADLPPPLPPTLPMLHDVKVRVTDRQGRVVIRPVPPEEFLIDRRAVSLEEAPFLAHRVRRTVSDLIEQGYPAALVSDLGGDDALETMPERLTRFAPEDEQPWRDGGQLDPSMREVWVTECFLRVDVDGDGIAELRKITVAGTGTLVILDNEEVDAHPFAVLTPILMPHKVFGQSIADQVMDLQLIKSTLLRQMLDNLYLTNNPEKEVVEGMVNLDDLLTSRPGGLKRVKQPGSISVLETPFVAGATFPMLEYIDSAKETRTGVTRLNQGLDPDTLNKTATGINLLANAGAQRLELIARLFAETGVRQAFRRILELVCKHQQKARLVRLRDRWVPIDPREWSGQFDLSVEVGLGTGSKDQQVQHLLLLLQLDQQILAAQGGAGGPLVTWTNLYEQMKKLAETVGLRSPERYLTDPRTVPPPPPPPPPIDPNAALAQAALAKADTDIKVMHAKAQAEIEVLQAKTQAEIALDHKRAFAKAALDRRKPSPKGA